MRVLFFCRDEAGAEQLVLALRTRWPDLTSLLASRGDLGVRAVGEWEPDLVVICEDLPDLEVSSAITRIRRLSDVPIIVAAERAGEMEVVRALQLGADDYIALPRNLLEVTARVMALMRRVGITRQRGGAAPIQYGDLVIDTDASEAFLGTERLSLTPTEFKLLCLLAKNRQVTLSQQFLQRVIWTDTVDSADALKKYIQRLRRKLGDDARDPTWITTVHGVGYRFNSPAATAA